MIRFSKPLRASLLACLALSVVANVSAQDEKPQAGMIELPTELPKAVFIGTPQNINVPNLKPPLGEPRPPFLVPEGTTNLAKGKKVVEASDDLPIMGELTMITDGDKAASDASYVELGPFVQWITIDLEKVHDIYAVLVWHYHMQARVYYDVVVQISEDLEFSNPTTIFNNDIDNSAEKGKGEEMHYVETSEGLLVDAKGARGRYVRLYSNGSNASDLNHYTEVEVFGK